MKLKRRDIVFLIICIAVMIAAVVFALAGTREVLPVVDSHDFTIPVTYEKNGEKITNDLIYECYYNENNGEWSGYYSFSGQNEYESMIDFGGEDEWFFELELNAGYLMGDEMYADFYADGMPEPTLGYYDEEYNEHTGETEAQLLGIKLIGCDYPEPISNSFVDAGAGIEEIDCVVLAVAAFVLMLLSLPMVRKEKGVTYTATDNISKVFNVLIAASMPVMVAICIDWEMYIDATEFIRLIPCITALGVCASIVLRRKGVSGLGFIIQFAGPALLLGTIVFIFAIGFSVQGMLYPLGMLVGVLIAVCSKPEFGIFPTKIDSVTIVSNIILIPVYSVISMPFIFVGSVIRATNDSGMICAVLGMILSILVASVPVFAGVGLGLSTAYRKKGRSRKAFIVQFLGFLGVLFSVILTLIAEMIPWINSSIN